jgi:hypothetical protein
MDTLDTEEMFELQKYFISQQGYVNDSTYQITLEGWAEKVEPADAAHYAKVSLIVVFGVAAAVLALGLYYFVFGYSK